jgi:AcrR family transcriptional regulator
MSLYRYFPSKTMLLEGVLSSQFEKVVVPDSSHPDWRRQIRIHADSVRQVALEHPRLIALAVAIGGANPVVRGRAEALMAVWRGAGFSEEDAELAQRAFGSYLVGELFIETGLLTMSGTLRSLAPRPAQRRTLNSRVDSFRFGLDLILSALQSILDARRKAAQDGSGMRVD